MQYQAGYNHSLVFRDDPEPHGLLKGLFSSGGQLPSFFLVGAQKSGTTSLFAALADHPSILKPRLKEPFYYGNDIRYAKGRKFYAANFPATKDGKFYADGSTNYLDHPLAAVRIREDVPVAKIIVILRNPVERAYSHYRMQVRNNIEELTFDQALEQEEARIHEGLKKSPQHNYCYQRLGYRSRGEYSRMLPAWQSVFGSNQLLVLCAEDFFAHPMTHYHEVLRFLGLSEHSPSQFEVMNAGEASTMSEGARILLEKHFAPFNLELEKQVGRSFNWTDK